MFGERKSIQKLVSNTFLLKINGILAIYRSNSIVNALFFIFSNSNGRMKKYLYFIIDFLSKSLD